MMSSKDKIVLPAEWSEQEYVQLTWPHEQTDWAPILDEVNKCFVAIAKTIVRFQKLIIVCVNRLEISPFFNEEEISKIFFIDTNTNDTWARDHGGITVFENGQPVLYDFTFNGWGLKFAANHDNRITNQLYQSGVLKGYRYKSCLDFVLEGGSIESDGNGTLLTTSECLLSQNRNNLDRFQVEQKFRHFFGVKKILWLDYGFLVGDDTDSHIDTLARLCPDNVIAYVKCDDIADEHYEALKRMESQLKTFTSDALSKPYTLLPLPMADPVWYQDERLPATYANFLIINGAVLMPVYNSDKDAIAVKQISKAFPGREIVPIDCNALIKQHGSLHCVTMQYPKC